MAITGHTLSSILSASLVLVGVALLPRWRQQGYRALRASVLVSIFLVQVFLFAEHQFGALSGLVLDQVLLGSLDAMMLAVRPTAEPSSPSATSARVSTPTA